MEIVKTKTEKIQQKSDQTVSPEHDNEELLFHSNKKITLRCGRSSITLYPSGKIVLKGEYILSDAEGINRLSGGRVELN